MPSRARSENKSAKTDGNETRCSKVVFPNYSKKKPAEDNARAAAMGNTSKKMFVFLALFVDAAVRGGTCAFTLKIDTSYQKYSTR